MKTIPRIYPLTVRNILLWCLFTATLLLVLRGFWLIRPEQYPVRELDSGWTIERNGIPEQEDTLSRYKTGNIAYGESILLTRTLADAPELPSACLFFRNLHCAVTIHLDGNLLFTDGLENYESHTMAGRHLCFVPLPASYGGKQLTIELVSAEEKTVYSIGPFLFGLEQDLFTRFLKTRLYTFYIALFLCIFAVLQLLWLPFPASADASYYKLLFSAFITLVYGVYLLGYYNLFDLFTDIPNINTMLEHLSLYLVPCALSGYIASITEGKLKLLYSSFVVFDILVVLLELILHFMNAVHFTRFLLVCYAIGYIETVPFLFLLLKGWGKHRKTYYDRLEDVADRMVIYGFLVYVAGIIIDGGVFLYTRYTGGQEAVITIPFTTVTCLIYSFALCVHYFLHGVMSLRTETTRQKLQEKAYSDSLTGLSNRGECELVLSRLGREYRHFTVISFDLDDLKLVNDTLGHAEGDRMLRVFSTLLKETFADATLTGRMGGDEFLVVLTGDMNGNAEVLLKEMSEKAAAFNRTETVFQIRFSYGIARSGDARLGRRANDIYMLADARMYDMKRRHKK